MGEFDLSRRRGRVIIIDDDRDVRDVMTEVFELAGYQVSVPSDHPVRLEEIAAARPDVIVLDLLLGTPDQQNGWAYLRALRSHSGLGSVPVVIVSADVTGLREHAADVLVDPLVSVVEKPFGVDQLEQAVAARLQADGRRDSEDPSAMVLVADAEAHLVSASPAALRFLGLSADELRQHRVADIVAHGTEWTRREWQRYLTARHWEGWVTLHLPDGREIPAYSRAEILSEGPVELHVTHIDVSESPVA